MPICYNCNSEFPNRQEVDGKIRNLSARKYCLSCSPFGLNNRKTLETKTRKCKMCNDIFPADENHFYRNGTKLFSYCIPCEKKRSKQKSYDIKKLLVEYKGGSCSICGYDKCLSALDFHHLDPSKKDFHISSKKAYSLKKLKPELDKCILVCANCHREIHAGFI